MAPQLEDDMNLLGGVAKYGLLPGVALFLVWQMTTSYSAELKQNSADLRLAVSLLQQHVNSAARMESNQQMVVDIMRQNCVNNAHNPQQTQACWNAGFR